MFTLSRNLPPVNSYTKDCNPKQLDFRKWQFQELTGLEEVLRTL